MFNDYIVVDVETTIKNKGNPFTKGNWCVYSGFKPVGGKTTKLLHKENNHFDTIKSVLETKRVIIAFNAKFDSHWLQSLGHDVSRYRIWDLQYAEYLFSNQQYRYPSLEESSVRHGLGNKIDVVERDYWSKGIDTPDIPEEIMMEYLEQDLSLEEKLFLKQYELFQTTQKGKWRLFLLHMEDQHSLRDMESNGIVYDHVKSLELAESVEKEIKEIEKTLLSEHGYEGIPINFDSGDHLSAYLYGGSISVDTRIPVGVYKTGNKAGEVRFKIVSHTYNLPRQVAPLPRSELKKEGFYATDEKTLKKLRGTREFKRRIGLLDQRSKLEKLRGTYYSGFPKKLLEMAWSDGILHSSLNQCVAVTGRLSSTNPNQQNMPPECKRLCISRYE